MEYLASGDSDSAKQTGAPGGGKIEHPARIWPRRAVIGALLPSILAPVACTAATEARSAYHGALLEQPVVLPAISLARAAGGRFETANTRGRLSLFFFGYTICPDVCPLTMANVARTRRLLGARAAGLDAYFVTVDPDRDTPVRLLEYAAHFDHGIAGLTGTPVELAGAHTAFGVVAEKRLVPGSAAAYLMDHTALVYLVDQESRIRLLSPMGHRRKTWPRTSGVSSTTVLRRKHPGFPRCARSRVRQCCTWSTLLRVICICTSETV